MTEVLAAVCAPQSDWPVVVVVLAMLAASCFFAWLFMR